MKAELASGEIVTLPKDCNCVNLAVRAVREGKQILHGIDAGKGLRLIEVKEVKFVTHSIPWDKEPK